MQPDIKCAHSICVYESHLGVIAVVHVARSTGIEVTHVLLQGPRVLCALETSVRWNRHTKSLSISRFKIFQMRHFLYSCVMWSYTCVILSIQTVHCSRPQKRPALKPPQTLYKVKYNEIGTELEGAINMTYTVPWAQNEYICRHLIALMINIRDSVPGAERSNPLSAPRSLRHSLKFITPVWRTEVVVSMCPNRENISSIFSLSAFPYKQIQVFEQTGFHAYWFVLGVSGETVFWPDDENVWVFPSKLNRMQTLCMWEDDQ